jgi:hypothetical protein
VLLTERGEPEQGVAFNLRSLDIRIELGSPEVGFDLVSLARQRELLGEMRFRATVKATIGAESVAQVLTLLQQVLWLNREDTRPARARKRWWQFWQ